MNDERLKKLFAESRKRQEEKKRKEKEKRIAKKERKKEKKREENLIKRMKHKKHKKKIYNRRQYKKYRKKFLAQKKKEGDRYGFFRLFLTRNKVSIKYLGFSYWMNRSLKRMEEYINENRKDVLCPKLVTRSSNEKRHLYNKKRLHPIKYEIVLVEKIPEGENNERRFRNENGTFITNRTNKPDYAIVTKMDWYIEEKYKVYGYNHLRDRKTCRWILDNIILKNDCRNNVKRLFVYRNTLIVQYDSDFDMIICKSQFEAARLYEVIRKNVKSKYILFTGKLARNLSYKMKQKIVDKTGWDGLNCYIH